ncbi:MAG: Clp protease N-terminal domain-containing protein, partial [Bacteroidia bacterium]
MDLNKLTVKAQQALQEANNIASQANNPVIENAHILKGILVTDESVTPFILKKFNANLNIFNKTLDSMLASLPKVSGGDVQLSSYARQSLQAAFNAASEMKDEFITIEHLLLGLLESKDSVGKLLKDNGINKKDLKQIISELRKGEKITSQDQENTYNALSKYAKNLNDLAKSGKLDPV